LRRIIGEFQHLLRFPTVDVAEMCKRAGDELWDLVKQPAELEFPLKFSQDLRQLTGKGCSEAHLIVHSVLYAVMCAILEDRDPDYRRREIALPGAGSFELFLREDAPKQWTKAELQKKLTLLRKAATAAETLLAALGTDRSSDYLKSVSAYASTVSYAPVLIEALCDCVEAVARRHQTTMRWFRDLRDANLALLAVHVRQCTGRFHWELLANLIDPWTVKCETVTADVLRLRFQRIPRSALQQAELSEPIKPSA
jgi:hypothetical protein